MDNNLIYLEQRGEIVWLKLNSPPVNALSNFLRVQLAEAVAAVQSMDVKCAIIYGEKNFIAGADITELGEPSKSPSLPDLVNTIEQSSIPFVAAINGYALGGGLEVALACHYRMAVVTAKLGAPETHLSILPGAGGTQRLPRLIDSMLALDLVVKGKSIMAQQAYSSGLIDKIFDLKDQSFEAAVLENIDIADIAIRRTSALQVINPISAGHAEKYLQKLPATLQNAEHIINIVSLFVLAGSSDFKTAIQQERTLFIKATQSQAFHSKRHLFFAQRRIPKFDQQLLETAQPHTAVGIVGAGTMGIGIATAFLQNNCRVVLIDKDAAVLEKARHQIHSNISAAYKARVIKQILLETYTANLILDSNLQRLSTENVPMVIEAVFEKLVIKQAIFRELSGILATDTIVASNTSYLDLDLLAKSYRNPTQFIGTHFFSPANRVKLVELVRCEQTDDLVLIRAFKTLKKIKKLPLTVGCCKGFVGNRIYSKYRDVANVLLLEGATVSAIDLALEQWGFAMGVFAVGDMSGLDIAYFFRRDEGLAVGSKLEFALADTLVETNQLGRKTGRGYYIYSASEKKQENKKMVQLQTQIASYFKVKPQKNSPQQIVHRLLAAMVCEAAKIVDEKMVSQVSDIDVVMTEGFGFPKHRGGPLFAAQSIGLDIILQSAEQNAKSLRDNQIIPESLRQLVASNSGFY